MQYESIFAPFWHSVAIINIFVTQHHDQLQEILVDMMIMMINYHDDYDDQLS